MKSWLRKVLKIIPIELIIEFVLDGLADQAAKTQTEIDDKAVEIVRTILMAAFSGKD
jgi:hypothetical protein